LDKKMKSNKNPLVRFRGWIQAAATLLTNIHIPNLFKGKIYQGNVKTMCVPGLNCYSCPAATGACPIGAFQAVVGSSKFKFTYYITSEITNPISTTNITGFFILLGVLLGRFICGFLCPFGWFQDLLHKIPGKKFSTAKLKPLRYLKYVILVVFVILLPAFVTNSLGMGDPFFCKYICPQGVLEGAIPLALANSGIRAALGHLFTFKFTILALFIILSILFYRPFCKWICPLGAIYSLFNKVSFLKIQVDHEKCVGCQKCSRVCKMDVNVVDTPNHPECIRCGECMKACPTDAICYHYGFSNKKKADNK
jgi:ferredoxin-type protein NapH